MTDQKVDRRIQRTRKLLQDALIDLILEIDYNQITVQDIIDRANVGRSTFYAHYLDKDDLMESSVEELRAELEQHFVSIDNGNTQNVMMPSLALFKHIESQHHLYKAMVGGRGIEIVTKAIHEDLAMHARTHFEEAQRAGKRFTIPIDILITYLAETLQSLMTWWLDNDMPYPPERMNEIFLQLVMSGIEDVIE